MGKPFFYLLKLFGFDINISIIKSVLIRYRIDNHTPIDRFFFIEFIRKIILILKLFIFPFKLERRHSCEDKRYIFEPFEKIRERENFINNFKKENKKTEFILGKKSISYDLDNNKILKIWFLFIKVSIYNLFCKSYEHTKYIWPLFNFLLIGKGRYSIEIYLFRPYSITTYLAALILPKLFSHDSVNMILSNTSIFPRRYNFLPDSFMLYCSVFQKEELKSFIDKKWTLCKGINYTDLEETLIKKRIKVVNPMFEIGIYSSGYWARKDGMARVNNISFIRMYKYAGNKNQIEFEKLIHAIGQISNENNFRVKCYFHPYEKILFNEYRIAPPYLNILKGYKFEFEISNLLNSLETIHESKIGVSLFSTIITDRWNEGLDGMFYIREESAEYFSKKHIGSFEKNIFHSLENLKSSITKRLN